MEAKSTLESLLISNDPPPDAEIPVIRDIIADEQSRLLDLDTQIAALQKILEPLVDERNAIADKILRHQSVISVARRVPPEILGEILLLTLPSQEDGMSDKASCVDSSPWIVGRICSRWREIALALPELWTTVSINELSYDLGGNDVHPSILLCRLKMQLHRSANQPLSIVLGSPSYESDWTISPEILEILADSSPRWETVQADSTWFSPGSPMDRIKGRLDKLKSLSFSYGPPQGELFADAPQLRRLESTQGFASEFPWAQLTYLKSGISGLSELIRILPQLVNVVECDMTAWFVEGDDTTADDISLPVLQKLTLQWMPLPSSLIAPRLTHLGLGAGFIDTIAPVVSRSGCDLRSVTLLSRLDRVSGATVSFSALQHYPTICELKINDASDINALCAMLTIQQDSPIALPKLNDLMFFLATDDPTSVSGLNLEIFVAMLKSRWDVEGCARIRHVHIDTGWWHGLPFIEGL
ncbi:hypothetical protein C8J57DRAFT_216004 [Mycena rebaudengoi]|nr:hypothetical protein C8J57DRAFT_216004 [Mycena rebaudengoi]